MNPAPLEVIVVDNSEGDPATRAAAERSGARYLLMATGGLSAARNAGARATRGRFVAYIDDDAVAEPEWVGALARGFADPAVGAVTGRIRPLAVEGDAHRTALAVGLGVTVFDRETPITVDRSMQDWFGVAAFGGIGNGTNMAFRRSLFDGGFAFHEGTGRGSSVVGYDEHYAFLDLVARGYRVVYCPDAVVRHPLPDSIDDLRNGYVRDVSAFSAFVTLLLVETRHRAAVGRYLWQALRRARRPWRTYSAARPPRLASRARVALALAAGPLRYLRGRLGFRV
jgi:glycosyltransferase involved in cell wall biosynthesis